MLELRPNCECCNRDLPPESPGVDSTASVGRSMLSTAPRVLTSCMSAMPKRRARYFEPLSTFVCSRELTCAASSARSSSSCSRSAWSACCTSAVSLFDSAS